MKSVPLKTKRHFVYSGSTAKENSFRQLKELYPEGFIQRGCSQKLARTFLEHDGKSCFLGNEAIIDLKTLSPTLSVQQLCERGRKKVCITEINYATAKQIFVKLQQRNKPRLKFLYETRPLIEQRFFAAFDKTTYSQAVALVTLSFKNPLSPNLELMLRHNTAPVGTMEYLITTISTILRNERKIAFNLGEVPFINTSSELSLNSICAKLGSKLLSYNYNYNGLYNFKNKFCPTWEPVYWCGWPKLTVFDLFEVARVSNIFPLMFHGLKCKKILGKQ